MLETRPDVVVSAVDVRITDRAPSPVGERIS
jgi:hypothetical protein